MNRRALGFLLGCAWLCGCASPGARKAKVSQETEATQATQATQAREKEIARLLTKGQVESAVRTASGLISSKAPRERELGTYWKAVCFLYRDQPDSAIAIFDAFQGKWTGGWRITHAQAFVLLAREANTTRLVVRARRDDTPPKSAHERSLQEKVEVLQKEAVDLRAEVLRLETLNKKYEKLIKDLETIR